MKAFSAHRFYLNKAVLKLDYEKAVLEVMQTFQDPLPPGAIAEHLTAVNRNFEGVHPRVAVKKVLKDLAGEGQVSESGGQYQIVEQPPEAPVIEEPPVPAVEQVEIKAAVDSSTAPNLLDIQDDEIVCSIGIQFQDHSIEGRSRLESVLSVISES